MAETRYIEGRESYMLAEVVGRGGFATVWRARPLTGGEDVAIKVIPVYSQGERSRALREGQIAQGLKHPNIVETLEVIPGETEVYLVTEFIRGVPLDEAARHYTVRETTDAIAQILQALDYAHGQGIIHRDVKPQNALIDRRGRVKLTDFGVAYRAGDTRLTRIGFAVGTPGYIAPEIMDGAEPTALTDIYAVGATARVLLTRNHDELPPRLSEFINRTTAPNPAHRPQSAREALELLTGRRAPATRSRGEAVREAKKPARRPEQLLKAVNGVTAAMLAYMGSGLVLTNGAEMLGLAAGFGVAGYLLPRLAALGVIVALAVALMQATGSVVGFAALGLVLGTFWVAGVRGSARLLPLGPLLAVPLSWVGLGAGLPVLLGALMRPVGAAAAAAAGAITLAGYDLARGTPDPATGLVEARYTGLEFHAGSLNVPAGQLAPQIQLILQQAPEILWQALLWAAIAGILSTAERAGRWVWGAAAAAVGGSLGYALLVAQTPQALATAVTSLGLAAIIYSVVRVLESRTVR
ncbi:serine/threonine protein kinase [Rubrobacter taiwanensis]|jgi:hypothetical protein|uniref:non-specific serine/threonine protein kinase n=1 Tax=Rubrobacter taiwanensis TaxID=185139 RepID=A0A4R1BFC4_9ACTN|nr:serine/threonine-protein kinase [Rubrobacter taiwanensis]TCJ15886.1 serine/threonine protein kinase [Rubrobacter taiwanensis]